MTLYEKWQSEAYDSEGKGVKKFWAAFRPSERRIYGSILASGSNKVTGTVSELAERFGIRPHQVCGFLEGINDASETEADLSSLEAESPVEFVFDHEKLFRKMVDFKADHLYGLPEWDAIFDGEARAKMIREQRETRTFVRDGAKTGRNDPCPCGSGKKYKKCCGNDNDSIAG